MHHLRLVLNGPPDRVAALARDLVAAGAELQPGDDPPRRLTWTTPSPPSLRALCGGHARVVVGVERFALLGDVLERLVLRGPEVTVLERRPFAPAGDDEPHPLLDEVTLAQCERLPPGPLRAAAVRVAEHPPQRGPHPTFTAHDDALLTGAAIGRLCAAALAEPCEDLLAPPSPSPSPPPGSDARQPVPAAVLEAIAALAATALTAGAAATDPAAPGELAHERAGLLTEAHAIAGAERLWSRAGDADWPEWLMYLLLGVTAVVEDCAVALHQPPPPVLSLHAEHGATREERLLHASTRLVSTCLQALALFAPAEAPSPVDAPAPARTRA